VIDVSEIDQCATVIGFLRRLGLAAAEEEPGLTPLTGGVSSDLWKVDLATGPICVKGALAQLRVADSWFAPVSRNAIEYDWLQFAQLLRPGQVPRALGHEASAGLFAMEYLPPADYPVWKGLLLSGEVGVGSAAAVGDLIGELHSASAADANTAIRFATDDNFDALRIAPYLRVTARAHPDLERQFATLAERTATTHLAVVHGDLSPKNILLGPHGPVLLDAECAWFGDPAFDVAFGVNHLLLKSVKLPHRASAFYAAVLALTEAHAVHVDWEAPGALAGRALSLLPALTLARIDGSSPVEYLGDRDRRIVRAIGRELLRAPAESVDELLDRWSTMAVREGMFAP
jgi:aminoglycoside phosphotransferase (APT) family kinase protein